MNEDRRARHTEAYQDLKHTVKSKLALATRELTEVAKILRDFHNKQLAEGRRGLTKPLEYYLNELKFGSIKITAGLEEEIEAIERETQQTNQLNLDELAILMDRVRLSNEEYLSQKEASAKLFEAQNQIQQF